MPEQVFSISGNYDPLLRRGELSLTVSTTLKSDISNLFSVIRVHRPDVLHAAPSSDGGTFEADSSDILNYAVLFVSVLEMYVGGSVTR